MPLIMDEDHYMEDLFGDAEPVHIPAATAPKGLPQRLDELYASGCCQRLAWSKWGPVAAITPDRRAVNIYNFIKDPQTAKWNMSKPTPLPLPIAQEEYQLQHVAWSYMGNDLAVVDVSGRIMIFMNGVTLGKMGMTRTHLHDQDDEMSAVVGLYWLPVFPHAQQSRIVWSATRDGEKWRYESSPHAPPGPCNPVKERSALISLSRNGILRLLHQQPNGQWLEAYSEVESITTAKEVFTHASFAPETDNSLLLITYNASCSLQLYRVTITWNLPQTPKDVPSATMTTSCLLKEDDCFPLRTAANAQDDFAPDSEEMSAQLTHLEILPAGAEQGAGGPTLPTIVASFASVSPTSAISLDTTQSQSHISSIISRWELHRETHSVLHASFDQLTHKTKNASAVGVRESLRFVRQPDISLHAAILSISIFRYNTLFAFSLSDGSIEFRGRASLDTPITGLNDENKVYTMPQTGFAFPPTTPCIETALSPNFCAAAVMSADGSVQARNIEYTLGPLNGSDGDPKLAAAIAAMSSQYTSAVMQYQAAEDLFATFPVDMDPNLGYNFLDETYASLRIVLDYSTEEQQKQFLHMFRTAPFLKSLSAQALLGIGKRSHRSMSAKLAWATLNLRMASGVIIPGLKPTEPLKPEMAMSLLGMVRWSLDLLVFVLGELIDLSIKLRGREDDRVAVQQAIHASTTPALFLILSSIPRVMFRIFCGPLRQGSMHALSGAKAAATPDARAAYSRLLNVYGPCPVNIKHFEALVNDVDASVKSAYATSGISEGMRAKVEKDMFVRCEVPEALMPVVRRLLTGTVAEMMRTGNAGKVRMHDVRWLGLSDDQGTREWGKRHVVDVIRKVELREGTRLRRCTRCASVMEDIGPGSMMPMLQWLATSQRMCVCGGSWVAADV